MDLDDAYGLVVGILDSQVKEEVIDENSPIKATPKKRGAPKKRVDSESCSKKQKLENGSKAVGSSVAPTKIPTNEAELTEVDRLIIEMKEAGSTWAEISAMWEDKTGVKPATSTCRMRYTKLKANLASVKDADMDTMRACTTKVREEIEEEKHALDKKLWARVVQAMEAEGTEKYEPSTVEKAWKVAGTTARSSTMAGNGEAA